MKPVVWSPLVDCAMFGMAASSSIWTPTAARRALSWESTMDGAGACEPVAAGGTCTTGCVAPASMASWVRSLSQCGELLEYPLLVQVDQTQQRPPNSTIFVLAPNALDIFLPDHRDPRSVQKEEEPSTE